MTLFMFFLFSLKEGRNPTINWSARLTHCVCPYYSDSDSTVNIKDSTKSFTTLDISNFMTFFKSISFIQTYFTLLQNFIYNSHYCEEMTEAKNLYFITKSKKFIINIDLNNVVVSEY